MSEVSGLWSANFLFYSFVFPVSLYIEKQNSIIYKTIRDKNEE